MKTLHLLLFGITFFLLLSCNKEDMSISSLNGLVPIVTIDNQNISITEVNFKDRTLELAADSEDLRMRVIDCYLYYLIEDLIQDHEFNAQIIKLAQESKHNVAKLSHLLSGEFNYKSFMDEKIRDISQNNGIKDYVYSSFEDLAKDYIYKGEKYFPSIFIPNLQNANIDKIPIISAGVEADNEFLPELEDHIFASVFSEDFTSKEILINEEKALAITSPIFIIDNSIDYELVEKGSKCSLKPLKLIPTESKSNYSDFYTYAHLINQRYESIGNSEFCITGACIDVGTNPVSAFNYLPDGSGYGTWKEINSIHKNDIGDMLFKWVKIARWFDVEPYTDHYLFFNTFERDWAKSSKPLGSASMDGVTVYLYGKMKYSTDWYAYNPSQNLTNNDIDLQYVYNHYNYFVFNYLTKLQFYRVD